MSRVVIFYCESNVYSDVKKAVERGFEFFGGSSMFVRPNEKILIKPNWLSADPPVFKAVSEVLQCAGVILIKSH